MSLSGLNSGLYQQFYRYAELTDKALIELNAENNLSLESSKKLSNLFIELDSLRRADISARLIWILLTEEMNLREEEIRQAGELILQAENKEKIITLLETLARVLADEQESIKSRVRRGVR